MITSFLGTRIIESEYCSDVVLDFSRCRSPSRARRRLLRGIQGNVQRTRKPWTYAHQLPDGSLVMHPSVAAQLRNHLSAK